MRSRGVRSYARQASAVFLIGIVAIIAEYKAAIGYPIRIGQNLESISRDVGLSRGLILESIEIGDLSKNKESVGLNFDHGLEQLFPNRAGQNHSCNLILTWPEVTTAGRLIWEIEAWLSRQMHVASEFIGDLIGGGKTKVFIFYPDVWRIFTIGIQNTGLFDVDICTQLFLRSSFSPSDQISRGPPQGESEKYQKSVSNFKPSPEDKPEFGSLIISIIGLICASHLYRRFRMIGILLGAQSLFGLLFGLDLWSLWRAVW